MKLNQNNKSSTSIRTALLLLLLLTSCEINMFTAAVSYPFIKRKKQVLGGNLFAHFTGVKNGKDTWMVIYRDRVVSRIQEPDANQMAEVE